MMLTPNGRFEIGGKICLNASAHHPELWQPTWSIRTLLSAIIGFMITESQGAIGAVDMSKEKRKQLAKESVHWKCDQCGSVNKNAIKETSEPEIALGESRSQTLPGPPDPSLDVHRPNRLDVASPPDEILNAREQMLNRLILALFVVLVSLLAKKFELL